MKKNQDNMTWFMDEFSKLLKESYSRSVSENIKRGLTHRLSKGKYIGKPPFGYIQEDNHGLSLHFTQSEIVEGIFNRFVQGETLSEIDDYLDSMDPFKIWNLSYSKVIKILQNPFYYGYILHERELYRHKYPLIVTEEVFNKAQEELKKRGIAK